MSNGNLDAAIAALQNLKGFITGDYGLDAGALRAARAIVTAASHACRGPEALPLPDKCNGCGHCTEWVSMADRQKPCIWDKRCGTCAHWGDLTDMDHTDEPGICAYKGIPVQHGYVSAFGKKDCNVWEPCKAERKDND